MKYVVYYHPQFSKWDTADGVIFKDGNVKNRIYEILDFSTNYPHLLINFELSLDTFKERLNVINTFDKEKIIVSLASKDSKNIREFVAIAAKNEIPFCINAYNWSDIDFAKTVEAKAIYAIGDICFNFTDIHSILKDTNIKVFCCPNVAQGGYFEEEPNNFFIPPEDISFYEEYVDYCILVSRYAEDGSSLNPQPFFEVYAEDKVWNGPLDAVIIDGPAYHSNLVPFPFSQHRVNCGKRCIRNNSCVLCFSYANTAKLIESNGSD